MVDGQNGTNGKDGANGGMQVTSSTTDKDGNTVVTFNDGKSITVAKGDKTDGQTP